MDYIQDNFWEDCSNNNKPLNKRFQKNNSSICKNLNKTQNSTINSSTISYKNKNSRNCTLYINSKGFKKSKLFMSILSIEYFCSKNSTSIWKLLTFSFINLNIAIVFSALSFNINACIIPENKFL